MSACGAWVNNRSADRPLGQRTAAARAEVLMQFARRQNQKKPLPNGLRPPAFRTVKLACGESPKLLLHTQLRRDGDQNLKDVPKHGHRQLRRVHLAHQSRPVEVEHRFGFRFVGVETLLDNFQVGVVETVLT